MTATTARRPHRLVARVGSVVRWRLVVTLRSLRFVPPTLGLLVFLGLFVVQRGQDLGSLVATDVVALFVLGLWFAIAHLGALPRGHREITCASVGRPAAWAGEVLGAVVLVTGAAALSVVWPLALSVVTVTPDAASVAAWLVVVLVAGFGGIAAGCLLDAFHLRPPARFVVAVGIVALALARPMLAVAVSWPWPPIMDTARAATTRFPDHPAVWWSSVGTVAWSAVALTVAYVIGDRFTDPE